METTLEKPAAKAISFFQREDVKKKFTEILDKNGTSFVSSILSLINTNSKLQACSPESIYTAAMMAATLNLPVNQSLGFAYIIPYGDKAQFQMGYKGLIQLCQRTGQFKTISACPVYAEQLITEDPLKGYVFDFTKKPKPTYKPIGYAAYFSLLNGFEKTDFWTVEEVVEHGRTYSKTYNFGPWSTDFDSMALKTVLKLLLAKFAPMSIDMNKALIVDQAVINDVDTLNVEYVDEGASDVSLEDLTALYELKKDSLTEAAKVSIQHTIDNKIEANYQKHFNILKTR